MQIVTFVMYYIRDSYLPDTYVAIINLASKKGVVRTINMHKADT